MNSIIRILIFVLLIVSITWAQSPLDFGVKIGALSSKYEYKILRVNLKPYTLFDDSRIGPAMGFYIRYLNTEYFNIESEILYLQKGGEEKIEITTENNPDGIGEYIVNDIHFDYLQLHTSFRPKTTLNNLGLYGLAGFSINYLLQVRNTLTNIEDYNSIVFAYSLGAGIEFDNILNKPIFLEFLFNNDLTKHYDKLDFKFQSFLIRIGFNI